MNNKEKNIRSVFSKIPNYYDIMNDAMSFGMHRLWKQKLIEQVKIVNNGFYLDLSTGSGDIAKLLLKKAQFFNINLTCADPDNDMLIKARNKLLNTDINFVQTIAEKMPFADKYFDFVTLSFGLRNFTSITDGLSEISRVLKPEGLLYCLEFGPKTDNKYLQPFYDKYLDIIPFFGKIIAQDYDSYKYLSESIKNFPEQNILKEYLNKSGFSDIKIIQLCGGSCSIYICKT